MQILLAGATGVIGSHLLPRLVRDGHTVFGTTRRPDRQHQIKDAGGQPLIMDALSADSVREAVEQSVPELIMHQLTDLATLDFAGNATIRVTGTRHLVDTAKAYGCQRMITQSIAWAYRAGDSAADETEPLDLAASGRGAATNQAVAAMESATAELRRSVVLRYGMLYGPGTWFAPGGPRVDEARAGTLTANSAITNFVHVDDAAEAGRHRTPHRRPKDREPEMARLKDIVFDCRHAASVARFWAEVMDGYAVAPYDDEAMAHLRAQGIQDPEDDPTVLVESAVPGAPRMFFQTVPEAKTVKNRVHLDLISDDLESEIARLISLGAHEVARRKNWVQLADPEGNELCLFEDPPSSS